MINDLKLQTKESIVKFLQGLGKNVQTYSAQFKGVAPLFKKNEGYVFANEEEIVLVVIDTVIPPIDELADEERFCGEHPLYFTQNNRRPSPVWDLAVTLELIRRRLTRVRKHIPQIWGVFLTSCNIINYEDMLEQWSQMDIMVFHRMEYLRKTSWTVNENWLLLVDLPLEFIGTADYEQWEIDDVEEKLARFLSADGDCDQNDVVHDDDVYDDEEPAVPMNRVKIDINSDEVMKDVASVEFLVQSVADCDAPLYTDSRVTVSLTACPGSYFMMDQFKCYVYTKDFFPMCKSETDGTTVSRSKGSTLTIDIPCSRIWVPGEYILLISDDPDDMGKEAMRFDFTLDANLTATLGDGRPCRSCGVEDTLISYIECQIDLWPLLSRRPGMAQLRRHAIKTHQLKLYNDFRRMMKGERIGSSQNLLISTRNRDVDEWMLGSFFNMLSYGLCFSYVDCAKLYDPSRPNPYEDMSEELGKKSQHTICLGNIGILLSAGGKVIVRKVVELMNDHSLDNTLWICGTRQEIDACLNLYPSLGKLFLKENRLEQEPYNGQELVQTFVDELQKEGLECSQEAKDALARAVLRGYGKGILGTWTLEDIRRYVCEEVRPRYLEHGLSAIRSEELPKLSVEDLCLDCLTSGVSSLEESMRKLNAMVGLDEVKQGIMTMANNARLYLERRRRGLKTSDDMVFHCIFMGNPGTGKTTVARMLGKIYHALGLLSKGEVIVADRTRLVGQYIGQTEDNMKVVLEEARGNVLFIDEAYTLYTGSDDKKDFGMRVIESLLTVLTQPNPDMLIVFAGYTKEMDAMLSTNPGLSGRFPYRYIFNDYTEDQLMLIAGHVFERDEYILSDEATVELRSAIAQTLQQKLPNFGNARWIEQFVKNGIIPAMADRVFSTGCDDFQRIDASDVRAAFEKFSPKAIELKPRHRVKGFSSP